MAEVLAIDDQQVQEAAHDFQRGMLVYLTGWTLDTIDALGSEDAQRVSSTLNAIRNYQAKVRARQLAP